MLAIIGAGLELVGEIVKIIGEDGDGADNRRLKDLKNWKKLKDCCRKKEARNAFMKAWKDRHTT